MSGPSADIVVVTYNTANSIEMISLRRVHREIGLYRTQVTAAPSQAFPTIVGFSVTGPIAT
jgi:hypothetical protein